MSEFIDAIERRAIVERRLTKAQLTPDQPEGGSGPLPRAVAPYATPIPSIDIDDEEMEGMEFEYSIFDKQKHFVLGGPLGEATRQAHEEGKAFGGRRWFSDWAEVEAWAKERYGDRYIGRKPPEPGDSFQWAIFVKKP